MKTIILAMLILGSVSSFACGDGQGGGSIFGCNTDVIDGAPSFGDGQGGGSEV